MRLFDKLKNLFTRKDSIHHLYDQRVYELTKQVSELQSTIEDIQHDVDRLTRFYEENTAEIRLAKDRINEVLDEYKNAMDIDLRLNNIRHDFEYLERRKKAQEPKAKKDTAAKKPRKRRIMPKQDEVPNDTNN